MKTYIEEFLTTFSCFHQMVFSFLSAYSLQQFFPQLTANSNFFHSHSPTKQTLNIVLSLLSSVLYTLTLQSIRGIDLSLVISSHKPIWYPLMHALSSLASFHIDSKLALDTPVLAGLKTFIHWLRLSFFFYHPWCTGIKWQARRSISYILRPCSFTSDCTRNRSS